MNKTALLATAVLASALAAGAASAQSFEKYSQEGDWQVEINKNMGPGCVAIQRFQNPTSQVQMGIDATVEPPAGYIAILVQDVTSIEPGQKIPASFDVDGKVFQGTFVGQQTAGFGGATVAVDNAQFIYDLANHNTLTISYGEGKRVIVDITDADAAFAAIRTCQEAQTS